MSAAIEIEGLTKVYGFGDEEVKAVDSLELSVGPGEVFGFLGPNGAGKTTTVQMLMQIIFPSSGRASLLGSPIGDIAAREKIGYLPELFQFHDFLRAEEFLDFHARLYGMPAADRKRRIEEVLELVGLKEAARSRIRTFSKGMLQRIGIGQAIINKPELLFLDEPTSALDPLGRRDVRDLILSLRDGGTTVFLNSHLLSEVEMTCSQIGILNKGKLIRVGDIQSLIQTTHCVDIRVEGLPEETLEKIRRMATNIETNNGDMTVTLEDEEQVPLLARMIMDSGAVLREFTPRSQQLEEVFVQSIEESGA
ncbi:MAG: ABC transporter ATP-binding protein [Actinobacteria bacterium]|nr:ABC transporter ATP-binding protein [Actinomycetota bacterium]